jgi:hypothetical protein
MYKTCNTCKEEKLFSDFSKDKSKKDGYCSQCKICKKKYHEANKECIAEYKKQYKDINKEQIIDYQKYYRKANKEKIAEQKKKYQKDNPAKINAKNAKRRAAKLQATPNWLTLEDLQQIENFYKEAQCLKLLTNQEYHIDHIVPLQGKNVCGLHVPWNMQILQASDNRIKSNKLQEE